MSSADFDTRARSGDPGVIAAYLSRLLQPRGIRVRVGRARGELHVALSAEQDLEPDRWSDLIAEALQRLQTPQGLTHIHGFQAEAAEPCWSRLRGEAPEVVETSPQTPNRFRGPLLVLLVLMTALGGTYALTRALLGQPWLPGSATPSASRVVPSPSAQAHLDTGLKLGWDAAVAARDVRRSPSAEAWTGVAQRWDAAIAALEQVPAGDPLYAQAQLKRQAYLANRAIALQHVRSLP